MIQIPNSEGQVSQPNSGDAAGSLFATYGMDFVSNRGRIRASLPPRKLLSSTDDTDLAGYAGQILEYDDELFAISDEVFKTEDANNPTGTWSQDATSGAPSQGNTVTDAVVFDTLLLVVNGDDIERFNGTTWASWWKTTRGQSALSTGQRLFLKVGRDGNLYIVDGGNKIYRVAPNGSGGGTITKTGAGTLDFSARPFKITCAEVTSSRIFFGFENTAGGEGGVIEWDMGPQSISPNRVHYVGTSAVRCIAVWNDTPIAVLSDGNIMYFNGDAFVDYEGMQFPTATTNIIPDDDFIHNNGWAIIDRLPHFLVRGTDDSKTTQYDESTHNQINFPSGVWCLDPTIGLYHRFALGAGTSTQYDYGQPSLKDVGALFAIKHPTTKFLASYEYYTSSSTSVSVIAYGDSTRSKPVRSWFITPVFDTLEAALTSVSTYFKKLASGEEIRLYYRQDTEDRAVLDGAWSTSTTFHTTDTSTDVSQYDTLLIKTGGGAGSWHRITGKITSTNTTVLTIEEANSLVTLNTDVTVECHNFRWLGTIDTATKDMEHLTIPTMAKRRKFQLLVELRQNESNTLELDSVIIK